MICLCMATHTHNNVHDVWAYFVADMYSCMYYYDTIIALYTDSSLCMRYLRTGIHIIHRSCFWHIIAGYRIQPAYLSGGALIIVVQLQHPNSMCACSCVGWRSPGTQSPDDGPHSRHVCPFIISVHSTNRASARDTNIPLRNVVHYNYLGTYVFQIERMDAAIVPRCGLVEFNSD